MSTKIYLVSRILQFEIFLILIKHRNTENNRTVYIVKGRALRLGKFAVLLSVIARTRRRRVMSCGSWIIRPSE